MGVGSIGSHLLPYEDCDTFLSSDAGLTWRTVRMDAHKYEFGDQGSIMVVVNDEDGVDIVRYSTNMGKDWYVHLSFIFHCPTHNFHCRHRKSFNFGVKLRARALITIPDSTSQKFILLGQIGRKDQTANTGRVATVFLDFAPTRSRQCGDNDFEKWYARSATDKECIMGHKVRSIAGWFFPLVFDLIVISLAMVQETQG